MAGGRGAIGIGLLLILLGSVGSAWAEDEDGTYAGKDARWWIEQLRDREGAQAARVALRKIGEPALAPLAQALASRDKKLRYGAARALKDLRIDLAPILERLVAAVQTQDRAFQAMVLPLLRRLGPAVAPHLEVIEPLIESPQKEVAGHALSILGGLGPEARAALPRLLRLTRGGASRFRLRALGTAIAVAPDAAEIVPVAGAMFRRGDDRERANLVGTLSALEPDVAGLDTLVARAAADPVPAVRAKAASLLAKIAFVVPDRLPDLVTLLDDPDHGVRNRAAHALTTLGSRAALAVPALERVLTDPDGTAHVAAIRALAAIGPPAAQALPLVLHAFDKAKPSRDLRYAVTGYLASQVELTLKAVAHVDTRVRAVAFEIISNWTLQRWTGALPTLLGPVQAALATEAAPTHQQTRILDVIGRLAPDHPEALKTLLALRVAKSDKVRAHAARLIGAHPPNAALLLELLTGSDHGERAFAEDALVLLVRLQGQILQPRLLELLHHEDADVRERAGRLVVGFGVYIAPDSLADRDAEALAAACAQAIASGVNRGTAISRLSQLGRFALPHLDVLVALLPEDSLQSGGRQAAWALASIARHDEVALGRIDPLLLRRLEGNDPVAAARASLALGAMATHDAALIERLPALIRNEKKTVHFNAVDAAKHMGPRALPLLPVLLDLASSPRPGTHVDQWAVHALASIAPDDERIVRVFLTGLTDSRRKDAANGFLGCLRGGGENTIRMVADALAAAKPETQVQLLQVLAHFRLRASSVRDRVRPLVQSTDLRVSRAATQTLTALEGG